MKNIWLSGVFLIILMNGYSYWVDDFSVQRPMSRWFPSWTNQVAGYSVVESRYYYQSPGFARLTMDRKGPGDEQLFWSFTVPYPEASTLHIRIRAMNTESAIDADFCINVNEQDGSETWIQGWRQVGTGWTELVYNITASGSPPVDTPIRQINIGVSDHDDGANNTGIIGFDIDYIKFDDVEYDQRDAGIHVYSATTSPDYPEWEVYFGISDDDGIALGVATPYGQMGLFRKYLYPSRDVVISIQKELDPPIDGTKDYYISWDWYTAHHKVVDVRLLVYDGATWHSVRDWGYYNNVPEMQPPLSRTHICINAQPQIGSLANITKVSFELSDVNDYTTSTNGSGLYGFYIDNIEFLPVQYDGEIGHYQGVYEPTRVQRSMDHYITNDFKPSWHGWPEVPEWDDMWCEQPIRISWAYYKYSGEEVWRNRAIDCADNFLLARMQRANGSAHTSYRASIDEYDTSRVEGEVDHYDLCRGQAAFIEQMCIMYEETKDTKYLNAAVSCASFLRDNWGHVVISGTPGYWAYGINHTGDHSATPDQFTDHTRISCLGAMVAALGELYRVSNDSQWLDLAIANGNVILYAQETDPDALGYGLFSDMVSHAGWIDNWWMVNSFASGMEGITELYMVTGDEQYYQAIERAMAGLNYAYDPQLGWGDVHPINGNQWDSNGCVTYGIGRIARQALRAYYCSVQRGTPRDDWRRLAEQILLYLWYHNQRGVDHQTTSAQTWEGAYWFHQTDVGKDSNYNMECTCYVLEAQLEYYYLTHRGSLRVNGWIMY
ncbi:hypothetical protein J7M23_09715 [Candidatus Sumerlaeota bacterium]|nr:hypothetical protein [Candidatus Sumerlaeota bacterium]